MNVLFPFRFNRDLRCASYSDLYCRDFPHLFDMYDDVSQVAEGKLFRKLSVISL